MTGGSADSPSGRPAGLSVCCLTGDDPARVAAILGTLREIAERNGNANLLANADRMEAQAYEQYARKVSHLEKFGVTDPALDLDGDGFADPWTPDVDPLDDPLSDPLLEDPLGTLQSLLPFGR